MVHSIEGTLLMLQRSIQGSSWGMPHVPQDSSWAHEDGQVGG